MWSPLKERVFRAIWISAVVSNIGSFMQDVGSAWLMTSLTPSPLIVALLQTATFLPLFILSLPAGALSDIFDRRKVLIFGNAWCLMAALALGICTCMHLVNPWSLLFFTFILGVGNSFCGPAWSAIIPETVPHKELEKAIAMSSVGFNMSRGIGSALGGLLVAALGPAAVFLLNAVSFLSIMYVLFKWQRVNYNDGNSGTDGDGVNHRADGNGVNHRADGDGFNHHADGDGVNHHADRDGVNQRADSDDINHRIDGNVVSLGIDANADTRQRERISSAMYKGLEFVMNSPVLLCILLRACVCALCVSSLWAVIPLVGRHNLHLNSVGYGLMLSAFGIGTICGAYVMPISRRYFSLDLSNILSSLLFAVSVILIALTNNVYIADLGMLTAGLGWVVVSSTFNASTQLCVPDWVRARAFSIYILAFQGAIAIGSIIWGQLASVSSLTFSLVTSSICLMIGLMLTHKYKLGTGENVYATELNKPKITEII